MTPNTKINFSKENEGNVQIIEEDKLSKMTDIDLFMKELKFGGFA